MSIFCVARNYAPHAAEMRSELPPAPVFFMKPPSALLAPDNNTCPQRPQPLTFIYPPFSQEVHHELELVVRLSAGGSHIPQAEAHNHFHEVTVGIDFTARDLQAIAKAKGLPWLLSKGFDGSALAGRFVPLSHAGGDINNLDLLLTKNGHPVQQGNTRDMLFSVDRLIADLSRYITLAEGDLLYTGTPAGVGAVLPGDHLEGFLNNEQLFSASITNRQPLTANS